MKIKMGDMIMDVEELTMEDVYEIFGKTYDPDKTAPDPIEGEE